jgi:predicted peroxiredoxin
MSKYEKIEITEGTEKQIKFAKDLQNKIFFEIEDVEEDNKDNQENIFYYLNRLGKNAVNWINAVHVYGVKIYACQNSSIDDIKRKLDIAKIK